MLGTNSKKDWAGRFFCLKYADRYKFVKKSILEFWHQKLSESAKLKPSLKFLKTDFLPLGSSPHPLWLSCQNSPSATEAATLQAQILCGRYRDDLLCSKWNGSSGECSLCSHFPGDCIHYLSGGCPPLRQPLAVTLSHSLSRLSSTSFLIPPVLSALRSSPSAWCGFLADPSVNENVIKIRQELGHKSIWPLFNFSRALILTMHRTRMKLMET